MNCIRIVAVFGIVASCFVSLGQSQEVTHTWVLSRNSTTALNKILAQLEGPAPQDSSIQTLKEIPQKFPIPIFLDERALADASISLDESVDAPIVEGQSMRSYLSMILEQLSLSWSIEHDQLVITTDWHREIPCLYNLTPLLTRNGDDRKTIADSFRGIVAAIESAVDPDTWETNSGNSTIVPLRLGDQYAAVIRTPVSTHLQVQDFFRSSQRLVDESHRFHDNPAITIDEEATRKRSLTRSKAIRRSRLK